MSVLQHVPACGADEKQQILQNPLPEHPQGSGKHANDAHGSRLIASL